MWTVLILAFSGVIIKAKSDFVPDNYEEVTPDAVGGFGALEKCGEGRQEGKFRCVEYFKCDPNTNTIIPEEKPINTNGFGIIDIRFGENACAHPLDVCCKIPEEGINPPPTEKPTITTTPVTPPSHLSFCGIRNDNGIDFKITGNNHQEAEYGEFPWMVAILESNYKPSSESTLSICGGSLIGPKIVLTVAHCVHKFSPGDIKVRAGEWDTQTTKERLPYQERPVSEIIIHKDFKENILYNDVALLILTKNFKKAEHIGTVCLPEQDEVVNAERCFANGWGKNLFGRDGQYQVILKKIQLPMIQHRQCEERLQETRLGQHFVLHESFICAGGEEGKDTCTGDGGSPLVCPDPKNPKRYLQTGIVSWGIGCHTKNPGVYADVAKFRHWIDATLERLNLKTNSYVV